MVLCLILGVVAGWQIGRQKWESMPKEFVAMAAIKVTPRPALRNPASQEGQTTSALTTGELDMRLLNGIRDQEATGRVVKRLKLAERWKVNESEAVALLRSQVDISKGYEENQFVVKARMHSAEDAALVANTVAEVGLERVQELMDEDRGKGLEILEGSVLNIGTEVEDARVLLNATLKRNQVPLELSASFALSPEPSNPFPALEPYYQLPGVLDAAMSWDRLRRKVSEVENEQERLRKYWNTPVVPPLVTEPAVAPAMASGPDQGPHVEKGILYGMTIGLAAGLLCMFLCWKFFK